MPTHYGHNAFVDGDTRMVGMSIAWESPQRLNHFYSDTIRTLEIETHFRSGQSWDNGLSGYIDTTLPLPYLDTITIDDDFPNRGGGASDAYSLDPYVLYGLYVGLISNGSGSRPMRLHAQRGHRNPSGCYSNQVCVFGDQGRNIAPYRLGETAPGSYGIYRTNRTTNISFEGSDMSDWHYYSPVGSGSRTRYCDPNYPAIEHSCFMQFNTGTGSYSSVYQDFPFPVLGQYNDVHDQFTVEVAVRCKSANAGDCQTRLAVAGHGLNGTEQAKGQEWTIPRNNGWYRISLGGPIRFEQNHNSVRYEVYNTKSNRQLDVDWTAAHWSDSE